MFIELVDALRCPHPHADSWLVAATSSMLGRDIVSGTLGCPICRATFPIVAGVVRFEEGAAQEPDIGAGAEADAAIRGAAFLHLEEPGGLVVLTGRWTGVARPIADMTGCQMLTLNPPAAMAMGNGVSGIVARRLPLGESVARGIALDGRDASGLIDSAVRAVMPGGRIVAPVSIDVPRGVTELARDDRVWVGERVWPATLVTLEAARG